MRATAVSAASAGRGEDDGGRVCASDTAAGSIRADVNVRKCCGVRINPATIACYPRLLMPKEGLGDQAKHTHSLSPNTAVGTNALSCVRLEHTLYLLGSHGQREQAIASKQSLELDGPMHPKTAARAVHLGQACDVVLAEEERRPPWGRSISGGGKVTESLSGESMLRCAADSLACFGKSHGAAPYKTEVGNCYISRACLQELVQVPHARVVGVRAIAR